jgi:hypothetical protein
LRGWNPITTKSAQGKVPNMAGPSLYIQSPRAMMRQGTEAMTSTDIRMGSMTDTHPSHMDKGKGVERGETSRAVPVFVLDDEG